jgi:type III secretion protein D
MKQLRILTGEHSGARVMLRHGTSSVGQDDEADFRILDWSEPTLMLIQEEGQDVISSMLDGNIDEAAASAQPWYDYSPRKFGNVILCLGAEDDNLWPSDLDLLSNLLSPANQAPDTHNEAESDLGPETRLAPEIEPKELAHPATTKRNLLTASGSVAVAAMLGGFSFVLTQGLNKAQAHVNTQPLQARVARALIQAGLGTLDARSLGQKVAVEGLVAEPTDLIKVRSALYGFDSDTVVQRYAAADDVAQAITDALSSATAKVHTRYTGRGTFVVEGSAADPEGLRAAAVRVKNDIGPLVKSIDLSVTTMAPAQQVRIDAMLLSNDLRYVQTRDGTKHLVISTAKETDPDSLSFIH